MSNAGDVQARVYAWIEQQLEPVPGRAPLRGIALAHMNAADQLQQLGYFKVTPERVHDAKAELFRTAAEVAVQWSGYQRFAVQAYFGDATAPGAYWPFAIAGQESAMMLSATEPPNVLGMLRQSQRHTEAFAKIIAALTTDGSSNLLKQNALISEQLERTQKNYYELLERSQEILAAADERAANRARTERAEKRKDKLAERLIEALPIVSNKIAEKFGGTKLFASNAGNDTILGDMLRGLNDATFDQLLGCFVNPLHKAYVLELYKRLVLEPHKLAAANGGSNKEKNDAS